MSEYRGERTVVEDVPIESRPIVKTQYDSVVRERRGVSGVAIAALVVATIVAAIVITMLVINSQQKSRDAELAQERARTAIAQQPPAPLTQQPPIIVSVPQPVAVPVPYPVPVPALSAPTSIPATPSSADIERDVGLKLLNDKALHFYLVEVKVTDGIVTLSGNLPNEDLKRHAEKLANTVKGVKGVVNEMVVQL